MAGRNGAKRRVQAGEVFPLTRCQRRLPFRPTPVAARPDGLPDRPGRSTELDRPPLRPIRSIGHRCPIRIPLSHNQLERWARGGLDFVGLGPQAPADASPSVRIGKLFLPYGSAKFHVTEHVNPFPEIDFGTFKAFDRRGRYRSCRLLCVYHRDNKLRARAAYCMDRGMIRTALA